MLLFTAFQTASMAAKSVTDNLKAEAQKEGRTEVIVFSYVAHL